MARSRRTTRQPPEEIEFDEEIISEEPEEEEEIIIEEPKKKPANHVSQEDFIQRIEIAIEKYRHEVDTIKKSGEFLNVENLLIDIARLRLEVEIHQARLELAK